MNDDYTIFDLRLLEQLGPITSEGYSSGMQYTINFCKPMSINREGKSEETFVYTTEGQTSDSKIVSLTGTEGLDYT